MHEGGGNCLKYLKRGWNRTDGRQNKDLKKGDKLGQEVGALKKGGGIPLANYGPPCNMSITLGTEDQNAMNIQYVKSYPEIFVFKVFMQSNN